MKHIIFILIAMVGVRSFAEVPAAPELSEERIVFHTNFGDIVAALYPKVAPLHSEQMIKMVKAGVYRNAGVFRVEPGFVAQVENFDNRKHPLMPSVSESVHQIPAEFSDIAHRRGLLSMARYDDPNSAEASFSFMLGEAPHLDHQYTIFGEVVMGMDVLEKIESVPTDKTAPVDEVIIRDAEIISASTIPKIQLAPAEIPETSRRKTERIFEIFAALMFSFTVIFPIAKTALESFKMGRARSA